jgi:N-acetylglucosamine-6-sulfatase
MSRRRLTVHSLALVVAFLTAVVAAAPAAAQPSARPNIVLVLTDDQRWDTLAAMPTVQRELAGRGVRFANAFAVNPLCCPSRASILTGQYSHSTGVYSNGPPFGGASSFNDTSTIATWLQAAGYRTGYVGKYLNGYRATWIPFGWHRWVGYAGGYFNYSVNIDGLPTFFGQTPDEYSTDVLAREAVSFVETSQGPFFLVFAPYAPHGPSTPAPRHANAYADLRPARPPSYNEEDALDKPAWLRGRAPLTEEQQGWTDGFRRRQLASLLAVDEAVKRILDSLAASGRLANTMVVFTSDNGLTWGEHRLANRKVAAFEESIRIPLVVRYDALIPFRRTETKLVTNIDLAPTFAELGGAWARGVEGRSLVPLLQSPQATWRRSFLIEHLQAAVGAVAEVPTYCAVRTERLKYVVYATREEELYDLALDPYELVNRADDPTRRKELFALRAQVKMRCNPPPPGFTTDWICTLEGTSEPGRLVGTNGADTICGGRGAELVYSRAGADTVRAGAGADTVYGERGADYLVGAAGADVLNGGPGNDVVLARDTRIDVVRCEGGRDTVSADRRDRVRADCEIVRRPPRATSR